jgi:hypothetical protein
MTSGTELQEAHAIDAGHQPRQRGTLEARVLTGW